MEKKMTKKDYFVQMIDLLAEVDAEDPIVKDCIDFCNTQIELLDKKVARAKEKAQEKKEQGDELKEAIMNVLTEDFQSIKDICSQIDIEETTTSKVTARLTALFKEGKVEKEQAKADGKKFMTYRLATETENSEDIDS